MSRKRNTFSKAVKHLKSSKIEEKLQTLNEIPTMNTSGLYDVVPGALSRTEIDKDNPTVPDYSTIDWDVDGEDGRDTSGLFDAEGNSLFAAPPGDNSYILGPMAAMYYTWAYPWTMVGYIRESDRRMVNLGRIDGKLSDWDGSSGNASSGSGTFYSYGQLTLEQAQWFRDVQKNPGATNDPATYNYRAFYPGPPSNTPDAFGRYYCITTGEPIATKDNEKEVNPMELQPSDILAAILDRQRRGKTLSKAEKDFLRNRDRGWLGNAMDNIRNALSNSVPAFLGRAFRSLTDPFRYAGELMFQGNPAGRAAGLSNYWSPNPITAGGYTGKGGGFPGRGPTASGTITSAPRPVNTPRVSRSPLGQPQFKFPKGSGGVRGMVTQTADNAAVSALGRKAANTMGRKLGRAVPFVGAAIAVADATSRISNGDYGGAILSAASAIPGPLGWIALGTQMVTDGLGATGNRREEYIIETKTKDTFRDEFQQMGGFDIEPGDWGAAFLDELAKTNQIKDDEKAIIAAVFSGEDEGLMITDLQETLGKIMVRIANKEYKGKKPDVQETISEERKTNILKNLKNPVVLPESKKKHKVKPGQRYKGKTNFQGMDKLIGDIKPQEPFKKERSAWSKDWQGYNAKLSQNKKNQVLELVGDGKHYFDYMLNDSKIKNAEEMEKFWGLHPELYSYVMGGKKYKATRKEQVRGDYLVFLTDENGEKTSMLPVSYTHLTLPTNREV